MGAPEALFAAAMVSDDGKTGVCTVFVEEDSVGSVQVRSPVIRISTPVEERNRGDSGISAKALCIIPAKTRFYLALGQLALRRPVRVFTFICCCWNFGKE